MKKLAGLVSLVALISFSSAQKAGAPVTPKPMTVEAFLPKAKSFDQKVVAVQGKIIKLKFKTSKKGNTYTTFELSSADGKKTVTVYSRDKMDPKLVDGMVVVATGKYSVEKKLGTLVFKNEVDCTKVAGKPFGVAKTK